MATVTNSWIIDASKNDTTVFAALKLPRMVTLRVAVGPVVVTFVDAGTVLSTSTVPDGGAVSAFAISCNVKRVGGNLPLSGEYDIEAPSN